MSGNELPVMGDMPALAFSKCWLWQRAYRVGRERDEPPAYPQDQ